MDFGTAYKRRLHILSSQCRKFFTSVSLQILMKFDLSPLQIAGVFYRQLLYTILIMRVQFCFDISDVTSFRVWPHCVLEQQLRHTSWPGKF